MPETYVVHLGNSKDLMEVAENNVAKRVLREHIRESLGVRNEDILFAIINSKLIFLMVNFCSVCRLICYWFVFLFLSFFCWHFLFLVFIWVLCLILTTAFLSEISLLCNSFNCAFPHEELIGFNGPHPSLSFSFFPMPSCPIIKIPAVTFLPPATVLSRKENSY